MHQEDIKHTHVHHNKHTTETITTPARDVSSGATPSNTVASWDDESADKRRLRTRQEDGISAAMIDIP